MNQFGKQSKPSLFFKIGAFLDPIRPKWSYPKTMSELTRSEGIEYKHKRAWRQLRWGLERGEKARDKASKKLGRRLRHVGMSKA